MMTGLLASLLVTKRPIFIWFLLQFLPTAADLAGVDASKLPQHLDGLSLVPLLSGDKQPAHEYLVTKQLRLPPVPPVPTLFASHSGSCRAPCGYSIGSFALATMAMLAGAMRSGLETGRRSHSLPMHRCNCKRCCWQLLYWFFER